MRDARAELARSSSASACDVTWTRGVCYCASMWSGEQWHLHQPHWTIWRCLCFIFLILNKRLRKRIIRYRKTNHKIISSLFYFFFYKLCWIQKRRDFKSVIYIIFNDIIIDRYCNNSHCSLYNYKGREFSLQTFEPHWGLQSANQLCGFLRGRSMIGRPQSPAEPIRRRLQAVMRSARHAHAAQGITWETQ